MDKCVYLDVWMPVGRMEEVTYVCSVHPNWTLSAALIKGAWIPLRTVTKFTQSISWKL